MTSLAICHYSQHATYQHGALASQFGLETIWVGLGNTDLVRVDGLDGCAKAYDRGNESAQENEAPLGSKVIVVVQRQRTENVMVLVAGLAIVAAVLLVPPVAVGVAVSSLLGGWVDVAAVLLPSALGPPAGSSIQTRTWFGSASSTAAFSASVRAVRTWVNGGRGRAAEGTMARASGRAATMRLENMLKGCEYTLEGGCLGCARTWAAQMRGVVRRVAVLVCRSR